MALEPQPQHQQQPQSQQPPHISQSDKSAKAKIHYSHSSFKDHMFTTEPEAL